jgi:peptidyl-prolyl cis-trans isomerase D
MQIIQTIRDKGAAIVIGVIAISLIGFLLMDAKQGSSNFFSSLSSNVGKVNSQPIERKEFEAMIKMVDENAQRQASQYQPKPGIDEIRQQAWDGIVQKKILEAEFNKLGMQLTSKELNSLFFSNNPENPFMQNDGFKDPNTGQLDVSKVSQQIATMKKAKGKDAENYNQYVGQLELSTLYSKYSALLGASAYYPSWLQTKDSAETKNFANISYTAIPYNVINDSTIKITDSEIEGYVAKNKNQFKQEAGRLISYVSFSQLPSSTDSATIKEQIAGLKNSFIADSNAAAFLARNGSIGGVSPDYIWKSKFQSSVKDSILKLQKGQVFGPYIEGNNYVLAKLVGIKQQADSVRCRHILIKIADLKDGQVANNIRPDSTARRLIDSIAAAVKNGADFNALVQKYSDDPGSKGTKGEYSFNNDNQLVDSFYRTVFYEPAGTKKIVLGVDNNNYAGYHYIEVLAQYKFEPAYKVGYMVKEIVSSENTINNANLNATKLSGQKSTKDFDAYIAKNGLQKISAPAIKENDYMIGRQLQDARQLIKWAFEAKAGNVSEPFNINDQFIVATVEKELSEGVQDVATAKPMAETAIRNKKKAEIISKKIGATPTLESAATAYNITVQTAGADSSITFTSPIIPNIGQEPKVIGACFNPALQNKVSAPISGTSGVYVIKVNSVANKAAGNIEFAAQHISMLKNRINSAWMEGLKKAAVIKDKRSSIY